jgi:acetyl esterase
MCCATRARPTPGDSGRQAGVPVVARRFDGQLHGFFTMVGIVPGSAAAVDFLAEHIPQALSSDSP